MAPPDKRSTNSDAKRNSSHFVPRFLMRGWRTKEGAEDAWVLDPDDDAAQEIRFDALCCEEDDVATNDLWNDKVEKPASSYVQSLRKRPAPTGQGWPALEEIQGLARPTQDALFHLFWSFRSRNPDTPQNWNAYTQREYIDTWLKAKGDGPALPHMVEKYRLVALWLNPADTPKFALTDWTVFPLAPVRELGVPCLPIDPLRAILMVDKTIELAELQATLAPLPLGEISHGYYGITFLLPPDGMDDPKQRELVVELVKRSILKWKPIFYKWGTARHR